LEGEVSLACKPFPDAEAEILPSLERGNTTANEREVKVNAKTQTMSDLSIVLMAMSIVVALR
jgi:hypothetical protein